jgi:micrococcal nuclease
MKYISSILLSFSILFIIILPANARIYTGKVLYNHNGDTLTVEINGKAERVRLIGIDSQKIGKGALSEEAQLFLEKMTKGKTIKIDTDIQERDQFQRLLGYAYVDGKFINQELLKEGFATIHVVAPNVKYLDSLGKAQKSAREMGKGIWYTKELNGPQNNPNVITYNLKPFKSKLNIKRNLVHVNVWSKVYHKSGCKYYFCKSCTMYISEEVAKSRGYTKCTLEK